MKTLNLKTRSGLDEWINSNSITVIRDGEWDADDGDYRWIIECPFNEGHTDGAAFIARFTNGAISAGCHHDGCKGKKSERPPECNVSDPPETTFTVNIEVDSNLTDPPAFCTGTSEKGLSVGFPLDECPVTLNDTNVPFGERDYCLFGVQVKNTNKETSVMLFFHEPCGVMPGTGVWRTLRLPATVVVGGPGDFKITVDSPFDVDVVLTKNHQPFKEVPLTDTITVGDIVYTEDLP